MDYVRGRTVMNPVPVLRLICVADAMEWKHLPVRGGIYDQHPDFVEGMMMLMQERSRYQEEEAKRKEAESKRNQPKSGLKGRRR